MTPPAYPTHVGSFDASGLTRQDILDHASKIVASGAFGDDVRWSVGPMRPLMLACEIDGKGVWEASVDVYGRKEEL